MAGNRWPKHKSRSNAPPQQQHVQPQSQGQVQPQPQGQGQEQQQTFTNVYFAAASVIDRLRDKRGSLKSLAFACAFHDKKRLFALICEALKYRTVVEELLQVSGFTKKNKEIAPSVALVAVYDLLIGRGSIECGGVIKRAVTESKGDLNAALVRMKIRAKVKDVRDLLPAAIREQDAIVIPRYVRVNTLKMSVAAAVQALQQQPGGFALVDRPADISALSGRSFCQDEHLKDLLVFPSGTDFHDHKLYTSGVLILQDKASCFPAHVLSPSIGESVIDGCAAPGNKTSHVAALVGLKGHVHAFDLDPRRFKTMQNAMRKFGASNVECMNGNFLEIKPTDPKYAKVSAILLDPSCSGSGIVNRLDYLAADDDENESEATETQEQRLTALSDFQFQTVSHAMTFSNVSKVSYSTCSIHEQENEGVVARVLAANPAFEVVHALPQWPHRGLDTHPFGSKCVRAGPEDHTNGFFVSLFQRRTAKRRIEETSDDHGALPPRKEARVDQDSSDDDEEEDDNAAESVTPITSTASSLSKKKKNKKNKKKKKKAVTTAAPSLN